MSQRRVMRLTVNGDTHELLVSPRQTLLAAQADGVEITTIEGLESGGELAPIQLAFIEYGAVQCGFCTPGVIMSAQAVLNCHPEPDETEINDGMAGVLCRCTGHIKVKDAIRNVGRFRR